jgi:predicted metal-dependent enzyme (double-stranded beta helix superfamily)
MNPLGVKRTSRGVENVIYSPIPDVIEQEYSFSVTFFAWPVRWRSSCSTQNGLLLTAARPLLKIPHKAVREVLARAVSNPTAVLKGLGEPQRAEIQKIFHSDTLTILNVVWAPGMMVMPHNHRMWAVIGIYTGREDNVFWRRLKGVPNKIEAVGAKALCEMDAEPLGTDIIHSVINPINKLTGAIHIYGGDFFAAERSEWDSMTLLEHRSDGERVRRVFEEANARYEASKHIGAS